MGANLSSRLLRLFTGLSSKPSQCTKSLWVNLYNVSTKTNRRVRRASGRETISRFSPNLPALQTWLVSFPVEYPFSDDAVPNSGVLTVKLLDFLPDYVDFFDQYRVLAGKVHYMPNFTQMNIAPGAVAATNAVAPIVAFAPDYDSVNGPIDTLQGFQDIMTKPGCKVYDGLKPIVFDYKPKASATTEGTTAGSEILENAWLSCADNTVFLRGVAYWMRNPYGGAQTHGPLIWMSLHVQFRGQHVIGAQARARQITPSAPEPVKAPTFPKDVKAFDDDAYEIIRIKRQ